MRALVFLGMASDLLYNSKILSPDASVTIPPVAWLLSELECSTSRKPAHAPSARCRCHPSTLFIGPDSYRCWFFDRAPIWSSDWCHGSFFFAANLCVGSGQYLRVVLHSSISPFGEMLL